MPPLPSFRELLSLPLGPFDDFAVLSPTYHPTGGTLPKLERLRMRDIHRNITGLDKTDRNLKPPIEPSPTVHFWGILVVQNLSWLSARGREMIDAQLGMRDSELQRHAGPPTRAIKLENVLRAARNMKDPIRLRLWLRCEKQMEASFKTDKRYTQSLLLHSKDQQRTYEIISMDAPTYQLSRNFLARYRLVALISEIVSDPAYNLTLYSLDMDVLENAYLIKHERERLSYRAIAAQPDQVAIEGRLRHLSRAEIRSEFAAHAAWLLGFYIRSRNCYLNVRVWCEFIGKTQAARRSLNNGQWGRTYEDNEIWDSRTAGDAHSIALTLAKFGGTVDEWEKLLDRKILEDPHLVAPSVDDEEALDPFLRGGRDKQDFDYDSSMSVESTPDCSESESEEVVLDCKYPNKRSLPSIPTWISAPLFVYEGSTVWECPGPDCPFVLDPYALPNRANIVDPTEAADEEFVQRGQFKDMSDKRVHRVLARRVSEHYAEHLKIADLDLYNTQKVVDRLHRHFQFKPARQRGPHRTENSTNNVAELF
ncbi:unnamed protein product [Mycena citricolor]|uniref:Uncharacterized protein n=1 Tax=Mycena citricolor TaxID=2018698 RepID=A0AAD2K3Q1_9AGAR|nr:unnamed protein product [Mycena citricolor]